MPINSRLFFTMIFLGSSASHAATGYRCDFTRTDPKGQVTHHAAGNFAFHGKSHLSLSVPRNAAILELSPDGHVFSVSIGSTVSSSDRQFDSQIPLTSLDQFPAHLNYHVEAFTETAVPGAQPFQLHLSCKKI